MPGFHNLKTLFSERFCQSECFSLLNLFDLPSGDRNVELRTKFREIGVFYWACLILSPYFIAEQYLYFDTARYLPILIPLYCLLVLSPLVYVVKPRFDLYAGYVISIEISLVLVLMGCAGGNLSPGAFWLAGFPMIFGLFYGTRGVKIGSFVMVASFIGFIALNYIQLLPNLIRDREEYERVKLFNLIGFGIYNIIISYYSIKIETTAKRELTVQRQETENLLRILVHDIATPITAVQLMKQSMRNGDHKPEETLDLVESALQDIANIVQHASKIRAVKDGKFALDLTQVLAQDALDDTLVLLQPMAELKQLEIEYSEPDEPFYTLADASVLKNTILCNVLSNAIKFSHTGGVIQVDMRADARWIEIQISDHGIGMSPELQTRIFDPTQPTTQIGTSGERGTGFGLPLVKMLLQKLGGDIQVSSSQDAQNHGTRVTLRLKRTFL